MNDVIRSTYESQDEILDAIRRLHCPEGFECDLTFGNGGFWKKVPPPKLRFDLSPQTPETIKACSTAVPLAGETLRNCVFDPPFLTYVKNGRAHKDGAVALTSRFGGYYTYGELEEHYRGTLREAWRILIPGGVLVFKCQDIIHNHRMHCTHCRTIVEAEAGGFRLKDLFVLVARHRMPGPQPGTQRHARVWHSYFLVLQKPGRVPK